MMKNSTKLLENNCLEIETTPVSKKATSDQKQSRATPAPSGRPKNAATESQQVESHQ